MLGLPELAGDMDISIVPESGSQGGDRRHRSGGAFDNTKHGTALLSEGRSERSDDGNGCRGDNGPAVWLVKRVMGCLPASRRLRRGHGLGDLAPEAQDALARGGINRAS